MQSCSSARFEVSNRLRRRFIYLSSGEDTVPVGVQVVAAHYREDLCLLAGKAIEARGTPVSPIDPVL